MARGDIPAGHSDELTMLLDYLGLYRDTMIWKIEGLDEERARQTPTPDANSLLNLIVHLSGVETSWSERVIAGNEISRERDSEFGTLDDTTVEQAITMYRTACARTNEIVRGVASADEACRGEPGYSVRWVLLHLLEETARHAGHADITRELIDGSVGWSPSDPG